MSSTLESAAARANGAKSRGPVTTEGRAKSSLNAIRHGLAAHHGVVIQGESPEEFQGLLDSYLLQFTPASGVEADLVHALASTRWRLRRLQTIETGLFSSKLKQHTPNLDHAMRFADLEAPHEYEIAMVFKQLADHGAALSLLVRYEASLQRAYDRTLKQLQLLQSARQPSPRTPAPAQPNEPKPRPVGLGPDPCPLTPASHPCDNESSRSTESSPSQTCPTTPSATLLSLRT